MEVEKLAFSVEETGRSLGLGRNATYDAIHRGDIPTIRIGRRLLVPRAALERLLASATEKMAGMR